jgi:nitrate reductase gamma subunit
MQRTQLRRRSKSVLPEYKKAFLMHVIVPLFIVVMYSFSKNYNHVSKPIHMSYKLDEGYRHLFLL